MKYLLLFIKRKLFFTYTLYLDIENASFFTFGEKSKFNNFIDRPQQCVKFKLTTVKKLNIRFLLDFSYKYLGKKYDLVKE